MNKHAFNWSAFARSLGRFVGKGSRAMSRYSDTVLATGGLGAAAALAALVDREDRLARYEDLLNERAMRAAELIRSGKARLEGSPPPLHKPRMRFEFDLSEDTGTGIPDELADKGIIEHLSNLQPWQKATALSLLGYGGGTLLDILRGRDSGLNWMLGLGAPAAYGLYHFSRNPEQLRHLRKLLGK